MKHRLLAEWVVLWQYLGVRPIDVPTMTLDDVVTVEVFAEDARRELRRAAAQRRRTRRGG